MNNITPASIGIIGGADGPTAIFLTGSKDIWFIVAIVLLIAGSVGAAVHIAKSRKK